MKTTIFRLAATTNQEAFDGVCRHLATAKRRAVTSDTQVCMYLTSDGDRCAIGGIIDTDADGYDPELLKLVRGSVEVFSEGKRAGATDKVRLETNGVSLALLGELQGAHDFVSWWDDQRGFIGWGVLDRIASKYDLDTSVLGQVRND